MERFVVRVVAERGDLPVGWVEESSDGWRPVVSAGEAVRALPVEPTRDRALRRVAWLGLTARA